MAAEVSMFRKGQEIGFGPIAGGTFDPAPLNELRLSLGNASFEGLLAMITGELSVRPAAIVTALADGDFSRAAHESRALARAALNLGSHEVGKAALALEVAARSTPRGRPIPASLQRRMRDAARQAANALPGIRRALRQTTPVAA